LYKSDKKRLFSTSGRVLSVLSEKESYHKRHIEAKRDTPTDFTKYQTALALHKAINSNNDTDDWASMMAMFRLNNRTERLSFENTSYKKICKNQLKNRIQILNECFKESEMFLQENHFKKLCKVKFLPV